MQCEDERVLGTCAQKSWDSLRRRANVLSANETVDESAVSVGAQGAQ
jgi:hypothetical protein